MEGNTSVKYLQEYLRRKDYSMTVLEGVQDPARQAELTAQGKEHCFIKLVEEVGEVARAIHRENFRHPGEPVTGTLDEELWDVMYYVLCLADLYGIDMEATIQEKEAYNNRRYHDRYPFEPGR